MKPILNWLSRNNLSHKNRSRANKRRNMARAMVEPLEPRLLLATVSLGKTVDITEGFGYGSTIAGLGPAIDTTGSTFVSTFQGADPGEGLDLKGTFAYAVSFGEMINSIPVEGVDFRQFDNGRDSIATGVQVTGPSTPNGNFLTADYGDSVGDNALESVMKTIRYANDQKISIQLGNDAVTIGERYKLQLMFADAGSSPRGFDVTVENALIADEFSPTTVHGVGNQSSTGVVLTHEFTATDDLVNIELDGSTVTTATLTDTKPIINALTLEKVSPTLSKPLRVSQTGRLTMEALFYPKPGLIQGPVWNYGGNSSAYQLHRVEDTSLRMVFGSLDVTAKDVLNPDAWNHVAMTFNGDRLQLFVNGVNVHSVPGLRGLALFDIDRAHFVGGAGAIDEVRVWNIARTQANLQEASLSPLSGTEPGLVGYWNFDNLANAEMDSSPSGNAIPVHEGRRIENAAPQIGYVEVKVKKANENEEVATGLGLFVTFDVSGTANQNLDYFNSRFRKVSNDPDSERNGIIIPDGETEGRIYFMARADAIHEGVSETINVALTPFSFDGGAADYLIGTNNTATLSITDSGAFEPGVSVTDASGRAVTADAPLFLPVGQSTTVNVRLTSQPVQSVSARVRIGTALQSLQFDAANWDTPQRLTIVRTAGVAAFTIEDANNFYIAAPVSFSFTDTQPTDARVEEGNPDDEALIIPAVELRTLRNVGENADQPAIVGVVLNTPAPSGGLDVFYEVKGGTAVEGQDFQPLSGVVHVEEGTFQAELPIFSIDDLIDQPDANLTVALRTVAASTATSVSTFFGAKADEGLDLDGTFVHAVNFAGPGNLTVRDATFTSDLAPGVTLSSATKSVPTGWINPDYGDDTADETLEQLMASIRHPGAWNGVMPFSLSATPGSRYKLQLLMADRSDYNRGFDIKVEGTRIVDDFVLWPTQNSAGRPGSTGVVVTYEFTATDDTVDIELNGAEAPTFTGNNPIINALTLEKLSPTYLLGNNTEAVVTIVNDDRARISIANPSFIDLPTEKEGLTIPIRTVFEEGADRYQFTPSSSTNIGTFGTPRKTPDWTFNGGLQSQNASVDADTIEFTLPVIPQPSNTALATFTGPQPGEGLDLQGNFKYAVNLGAADTLFDGTYVGPLSIGDATFKSDDSATGVEIVSGNRKIEWESEAFFVSQDASSFAATTFTGTRPGQGLDLRGFFPYALNFGPDHGAAPIRLADALFLPANPISFDTDPPTPADPPGVLEIGHGTDYNRNWNPIFRPAPIVQPFATSPVSYTDNNRDFSLNWNRIEDDLQTLSNFGSGNQQYQVQQLNVDTAGTYSISSATENLLKTLHLYRDGFDPLNQRNGLLAATGGDGASNPRLSSVTLDPAVTYFVVTSGWAASFGGTFTNTISGPGKISVATVNTPGDATLLTLLQSQRYGTDGDMSIKLPNLEFGSRYKLQLLFADEADNQREYFVDVDDYAFSGRSDQTGDRIRDQTFRFGSQGTVATYEFTSDGTADVRISPNQSSAFLNALTLEKLDNVVVEQPTDDASNLATLMESVRIADANSDVAIRLTDVTQGARYKLQLLFADEQDNQRNIDVYVDGLKAQSFTLGATGTVLSHEFNADDAVDIRVSATGGIGPFLNAVTLEELPSLISLPDGKISVKFTPTDVNGQRAIETRQSGADNASTVNINEAFNIGGSSPSTFLVGGGSSVKHAPEVTGDDTLQWALNDLTVGTYKLTLGLDSTLLADFFVNGVSYDYEAVFTSGFPMPVAPLLTKVQTVYSSTYAPLATTEPLPVVPPALEPNNSPAEAFDLGTVFDEDTVPSQIIDDSQDKDYFRFTLDENEGRPDTLAVLVTQGATGLQLDVLDTSDNVLKTADTINGSNRYLDLTSLADGEYLARISGTSSSSTTYTLKFRTLTNGNEPEENETPLSATSLGVAADGDRLNDLAIDFGNALGADKDYYRFSLSTAAGRPASVHVVSKAADGNLWVSVLDAAGGALGRNAETTNDVKTISLTGLLDGDYLLYVRAQHPGAVNKYDIAFGATLPPRQSEIDPNQIALRLDTKPTANVTLTLSLDSVGSAEGRLSQSSFVFTPENWNQYQLATVTPLDDTQEDGDTTYAVTADASSTDLAYHRKTLKFDIINLDRGNFVAPQDRDTTQQDLSLPLVTIETLKAFPGDPDPHIASILESATEGDVGLDAFRISLDSALSEDLTVTLNLTGRPMASREVSFPVAAEYGVDKDFTLDVDTFDPTTGTATVTIPSGTTQKVIKVTAYDDLIDESSPSNIPGELNNKDTVVASVVSGKTYRVPQLSSSSADIEAQLAAKIAAKLTAELEILDVNYAGFIVKAGGTEIKPSGESDATVLSTFEDNAVAAVAHTIALTSKPTADVSVFVASSDASEGVVRLHSSTTISTFNGGDPGEGLDLVGTFKYAVNFGGGEAPIAGDASFSSSRVNAELPRVNINSGFQISPWFSTAYGSSAADNALEEVVRSIRHGAPNGNTVIELTDVTPGQRYKLQLLFGDAGGNRGFDVLVEDALISDNFSPSAVHGVGRQGSIGAVLTYEFAATDDSVEIRLDGRDTSFADKNPIINALTLEELPDFGDVVRMTFTPDNWNQPQTFYLAGVDDVIDDNDIPYQVMVSAAGEDGVYRDLPPDSFKATNADNDTLGITVTSPQATLAGRANVFSVSLDTQPLGEVRVTMTPRNEQIRLNGAREGDPITLTFTPDNWNIPTLIQATAFDDGVVEYFHESQIDFEVETGRRLTVPTVADIRVAAEAFDLGDVTGGVQWTGLSTGLGEMWFQLTFPETPVATKGGQAVNRVRVQTNNGRGPRLTLFYPDGTTQVPTFRESSFDPTAEPFGELVTLTDADDDSLEFTKLPAGQYLLRVAPLFTAENTPFELLLDDADRAFESVAISPVHVSIKDNDLPTVEILSGPTASEVFSEPSYFAVRLNAPAAAGPADTGVKVNFQVTGGRATPGTATSILHDYTVNADHFVPLEFDVNGQVVAGTGIGWVRVAPGDVQANIGIVPVDDKLVEDLPLTLSNFDSSAGTVTVSAKRDVIDSTSPYDPSYLLAKDTVIKAKLSGQEIQFTISDNATLSLSADTYSAGDVKVQLSAADAAILTGAATAMGRVKSEDVQVTLLSGDGYLLPLAPDKQDATRDAANLDPARTRANLAIFDDDVPGIRIVEIGQHTTLGERTEATFQVSLTSEPKQPVTLTLTPGGGIALVDPVNPDTAPKGNANIVSYTMGSAGVPSNVDLTLVSLHETDQGFTAVFDARLTSVTFGSVAKTSTLALTNGGSNASDLRGDAASFEIPGVNDVDAAGDPQRGNWSTPQRLVVSNLIQKSNGSFDFKVKLDGGAETTVTLTRSVTPTPATNGTLTFAPEKWFELQTVTIRALENSIAEPGEWHKDFISYAITSSDTIWDGSPVADQEIHLVDAKLDVGETVSGLTNGMNLLEDGLLGLEVPLLGSIGELPGMAGLFGTFTKPLQSSVAVQQSVTVTKFQSLAESSLNPLVKSGILDHVTVTPEADKDQVKVVLHLDKKIRVGEFDLSSDLGLEALGLRFNTTGKATAILDFSLDIAVGLHTQFGFFIDTELTALHLGATLSLEGNGATPANPKNLFTGQGALGFLQLDFTDDPQNETALGITFDVTLNDLDNLGTVKFFDIDGDALLAEQSFSHLVSTDANKDGRADTDSDGDAVTVSRTIAEPWTNINDKGVADTFPTVPQLNSSTDFVKAAVQANWNTVGPKTNTFDEAESIRKEGVYRSTTKGATTILYLDVNRNGKLDVAKRKIDPFDTSKPWAQLTEREKNSSEIWVVQNNKAIKEFTLSKALGSTTADPRYLVKSGTTELGTMGESLRKKLDKNKDNRLNGDIIRDGEGKFAQGTSIAFLDVSPKNGKLDSDEKFVTYGFDDFELDTEVFVQDTMGKMFLDLNGDGLASSSEPRLLDGSKAGTVFVDFNSNSTADTDEPAGLKSNGTFTILQKDVRSTTDTILLGGTSYDVLVVDGVSFIDLDGNGELTLDSDEREIEPHADQSSFISDEDLQRLAAKDSAHMYFADGLTAGQQRTRFHQLIAEGTVVEQLNDGDRLTLTELRAFIQGNKEKNTTKTDQVKSAVSELFTYEFKGEANLGLKTKTSISGSAVLPSFQFDLAVNMPLFNFGNAGESNDNGLTVNFNSVAVDLGSFVSGYVTPILSTANKLITPIKPIVTALNADTKLLGKIGLDGIFESDGKPGISLLEIARKIAPEKDKPKIDKAIKFASHLNQLVELIDILTRNVGDNPSLLSFGDFSLSDLRAASDDPANAASAQSKTAKRADGAPATTATIPKTTADDIDKQAKNSSSAGLKNKFNSLKKLEGFEINLFQPDTVLSLITGKSNVNLISYDIPDFEFDFVLSKTFPIWGPIAGLLEGGFNIKTDLSMGFDTHGIEDWAKTDYALDKSYLVFDGLFLDDWDMSEVEKDELTVRAYIAAGAGIDVGIASGFVKGGVEGIIGLDFIDVGEKAGTSDGKIRGSDIIEKFATNPLDLFELHGVINAFLGAEIKVDLFFFSETVWESRLATIELAKFTLDSSGFSGTSIGGTTQTGPIAGGTVWFDANNNAIFDDGEPFTTTDFGGNYELILPDGIDPDSAPIRVTGGTDVSTGLEQTNQLVLAAGERGNITAFTSLTNAQVQQSIDTSGIDLNADGIVDDADRTFYLDLAETDPTNPVLDIDGDGNVNGVSQIPGSTGSITYSQSSGPAALLSELDMQNPLDDSLTYATIRVVNYVAGQDKLRFESDAIGDLDGQFNAHTGVLTLSGLSSFSDYRDALRSVTFSTTGSSAGMALLIRLSDVRSQTGQHVVPISIRAVNRPPVVEADGGGTVFTPQAGTATIAPQIIVKDPEEGDILGAKVVFTPDTYHGGEDVLVFEPADGITAEFDALNGELFLSGSASPATYQKALRNVAYRNAAGDQLTPGLRTVVITVFDNRELTSEVMIRIAVDVSPPALSGATLSILPSNLLRRVAIVDPDVPTLFGATVSITENFSPGEDVLSIDELPEGIVAAYDAETGVLRLVGEATIDDYEAAVNRVTYTNESDVRSGAQRLVTFSVQDGLTAAQTATVTLEVAGTFDDVPQEITGSDLEEFDRLLTIAANGGTLTVEQSEAAIKENFRIDPSVELEHFLHFDEARAGNPLSVSVMLGVNNVNSVVRQVTAVLEGTAGVPLNDPQFSGLFSDATYVAISRQLLEGALQLSDRDQLRSIILDAADLADQSIKESGFSIRLDFDRLHAAIDDIVEVVRATVANQQALADIAESDAAYLARLITQSKVLANGKATTDLHDLASGILTGADVVAEHGQTGEEALVAIQQVALPPLMSPVNHVFLFEDEEAIGIPVTFMRQLNGEGSVTIDVSSDDSDLLPDGAITFTETSALGNYLMDIRPAFHVHGDATITLRVSDSAGSFVEQVFIVTVAAVNDAPQGTADFAEVYAGDTVVIDLHSNEIDHDGDILRVGLVSVPAAGQVVLNDDQTISYTADLTSRGQQIIVYQVDDGHGGWAREVVTIEVLDRPAGDFNGDVVVDADDINILCQSISTNSSDMQFDLNNNGTVDSEDVAFLVENLLGTFLGDANLDGQVNSADLEELGVHWRTTSGAGWGEGDFDCNGGVTASDLNIFASNWQKGVDVAAANADNVAVRMPAQAAPLDDGVANVEQVAFGNRTPRAPLSLLAPVSREIDAVFAQGVPETLTSVVSNESSALVAHALSKGDMRYERSPISTQFARKERMMTLTHRHVTSQSASAADRNNRANRDLAEQRFSLLADFLFAAWRDS